MKKLSFILLFTAFFCSSAFAQRIPVRNVAVIETQIDERSGAADEINKAEVGVITNEIRREAVNNLPRNRFNIMTSETVLAMGEAILEECAEENCVIALGSKIGADYIVRGIISKFRDNFTLAIEMYETEYGMLVATAAPIRTANVDELLEKTASACETMYKKFLESSLPAAPPAVQTPPPPAPPAAYTLAVNITPSLGGTVTRNPDQTNYAPKTPVILTAVAADGYRFTGWSGASTSKSLKETIVMDSNMTLTANFVRTYVLTTNAMPIRGGVVTRDPDRIRYDAGSQVTLTAAPAKGYRFTGWSGTSGMLMSNDSVYTGTMNNNWSVTASFARHRETAQAAEPPPRTLDEAMAEGRKRVEQKPEEEEKVFPLKLTVRISTAVLAAGGLAGGYAYSEEASRYHRKYENTDNSEDARNYRKNTEAKTAAGNVFYTIGWIGLSAFTLTFVF